jgi:hypothetical protein
MNRPGRRPDKFSGATATSGECSGRAVRHSLVALIAGASLLGASGVAHSGPCTAQIAQVEQQIAVAPPGPQSGPTAPQTLGAQLHHQPTPADVEHAERFASKLWHAALMRAVKADAAGDATGCRAALNEAKNLYATDQ